MSGITALDLFAGHGWGVACQWLGIEEYGVELMPEAVATRTANGMTTLYRDVWTGLETPPDVWGVGETAPLYVNGGYDLLIASPPCQTFSMAGSGSGRRALDEVVGLIDSKAYQDVAQLRAFGERHDPRTSLVLTPLTHVYRDLPRYVVLEQVPPVLPVWERMAAEMREWGYSVWTGVLNAEQYGVPQTRRRAVLIAKRDPEIDGEALPPVPTHSRYYSRDKAKLDPGVLPWVSMADALGWGMTERPYLTVSGGANDGSPGGHTGGQDPAMIGGSGARKVLMDEQEAGRWVAAKAQGAGRLERFGDRRPRELDEPAFTIRAGAGGMEPNGFRFELRDDQAWVHDRPSTTVASDDRIAGPGRSEFVKGGVSRQNRPGTIRVTPEQAAILQSYPPEFTFIGGSGKQALQIGNAVPPLLARAILEAVLTTNAPDPKAEGVAEAD